MEVSHISSTVISQDPTSSTVNFKNYHIDRLVYITLSTSLGGFLLGYDTAVVGGVNLFTDLFKGGTDFTNMNYCYMTSLLGAIFGCLIIGPIADDYG